MYLARLLSDIQFIFFQMSHVISDIQFICFLYISNIPFQIFNSYSLNEHDIEVSSKSKIKEKNSSIEKNKKKTDRIKKSSKKILLAKKKSKKKININNEDAKSDNPEENPHYDAYTGRIPVYSYI